MSNETQSQRRQQLYDLLGDLPDRKRALSATTIAEEQHDNYILEKLVLDLNGLEPVPAFFVRPRHVSAKRLPTILYNHSHGGYYDMGKSELIAGCSYVNKPPYAEVLTSLGYAALCIDMWGFGQRHTRTESAIFKEMLWRGQVMWGMMVYDNLRALDYLISRPDVDGSRIATLGMSMGSTMAWWSAALDERIKVCIDICCLTDFDALIAERGLDGHGIFYFVPRLLKHFTTPQINALIAPRAHLGTAGNLDKLTPPAGLDRIDAELKRVYADAGRPEAWKLVREDVAHVETDTMRREIITFLQRWL
jgi:dienelactone hydrolase